MTPDELHQKYYEKNPTGNHIEPSPETLRFMEQQLEINKENTEAHAEIKEMLVELKTVVVGIHEQTKKTNGWINKHAQEDEAFKIEYSDMFKDLKEGRKENKSKLRGLFWDLVKMGVVSALTVLGAVFFGKK